MSMEIPIDLTCWYLNSRRITELVGADVIARALAEGHIGDMSGRLRVNAELAIQKNCLANWLSAANPPTLGRLVAKNDLKPGQLFTHYSCFTFRGLPQVRNAIDAGKANIPMAEGYEKIDNLLPQGRITFRFHPEHLTSSSSWTELSGQTRILLLGVIKEIKENVIEVIPYALANPLPQFGQAAFWGQFWYNHLEVHIDSVDSFCAVKDIQTRPSKSELKLLRDIPESDIKNAFASIIGEQDIKKDWGGERSDLFSSRVEIDGNRVSTAFLFKGPAQFKPMTFAALGKNGDQIDRLFSEPADLFVLQHCHEVTPPVRAMMRAYAQQFGRLRLFCIIDGYDTIRILRAYQKCVFHTAMLESRTSTSGAM
jgi:hypothetical protein